MRWSAWLQVETLYPNSRSLFSALSFHPLPTNCLHLKHVMAFLFLSAMSLPFSLYGSGCRLLSTSLQCPDHCLAGWRGTAGQLHYPPLIYRSRERRWTLPSPRHWHFAHSSESKKKNGRSLLALPRQHRCGNGTDKSHVSSSFLWEKTKQTLPDQTQPIKLQ